jgi:hypothetical protein
MRARRLICHLDRERERELVACFCISPILALERQKRSVGNRRIYPNLVGDYLDQGAAPPGDIFP